MLTREEWNSGKGCAEHKERRSGSCHECAMLEPEDPPGHAEFSVCQFFEDGQYEYVRRYVFADEAFKAFEHYINSVGARLGFTRRVIITDGGDCVNFEWQYGLGITFPTQEDLAQAKQEDENGTHGTTVQ